MASWSERELEDWLWEHPETLSIENLRWIGRQVGLPDGTVVDLLGIAVDHHPELVVAELKAVEADGRALAQLMSYMEVLSCSIGMRADHYLSDYISSYGDIFDDELPFTRLSRPYGILVAPSFDRRTVLASRQTNVACREIRHQFHAYLPQRDYDPRRDDKWPNKLQLAMIDAVEEAVSNGPLPNG